VSKPTTKSNEERRTTAPIVRFGFEAAFEVTACKAVRIGRWIPVTSAFHLAENPIGASILATPISAGGVSGLPSVYKIKPVRKYDASEKDLRPYVSFYRMLTSFADCSAEIDVFKRTHVFVVFVVV
jgi:hypothetical protein